MWTHQFGAAVPVERRERERERLGAGSGQRERQGRDFYRAAAEGESLGIAGTASPAP